MTTRMNKTSKSNIAVADAAQVHPVDGGVLLSVSRNGNVAYVHGSDFAPILYASAAAARRALQRIRPDLEPTTI